MLRGMWDLPEPGIEPVSATLAGRFFTTEPPGKPLIFLIWPLVLFFIHIMCDQVLLHNTAIWSTPWQFNSKLNMKEWWELKYELLTRAYDKIKLLINFLIKWLGRHPKTYSKKKSISFKFCLFIPLTVKSFPDMNQQDTFNDIGFKSFWKKIRVE